MKTFLLTLFFALIPSTANAAVTLPFSFTAGGQIRASEVNANDQALRDGINNHEALLNGHNTRLQDILAVGNSCGSTSIDFDLTQALDFRVENLSADPTCNASSRGRLVWNTTDSLFKICNGSSFVSIAGTGVNTLSSVLSAGNSAGASNLDMNNNQVLNLRVENRTSDPAAQTGKVIYRTDTSELKVSNGASWTAIGGAQGLASVLGVSNSAGGLNVDFNGNQAVNMRWENLAANPGTTTTGRVYYNTASNKPFFYNGSSWLEVGNTNNLSQVLTLGNSAGSSNINVNGNQLLNARVENLAAPPGTGSVGRMWFDTVTSRLQYGTSGANKEVASLDDTQTLTNKTISGASNTLSNIPDGALSANVALLSGSQSISGTKTFSAAPVMSRIKTATGTTNGHLITDGLADDTFVFANAVQTLAGKTLNAPSLSGNLDFNLFQAVELVAENLAANPATPTAGRIFYKSSTGELLYANGSSWLALGTNTTPTWSQVLSAGASAGGTDPDINNRQLLNVRVQNVGALPANGNVGRVVWNTADNKMYGDNGTTWQNVGAQSWSEVLSVGASAGSTNPNFNNNQALNMRLENLAADPGAAQAGRVFYNTTAQTIKFDTGAAIQSFITDSSTTTFTNKTYDADGTGNNLTNVDDGNIKAAANIARSKLASGTANHVLINDATGVMTSEARLSLSRFSTGTANNVLIGNGVSDSSYGLIADANISGSAAIARSKLASGTASHVLINDGSGVVSSEAQLSPTRGGTGVNNSGTLTYGSNNITLTTSGATSVTLPTSGTLATLAGTETLTNKTLAMSSNTISGTASQVAITNGSGALTTTATLPVANGGTGQSSATAAFNNLSPSTTKGDIIVHNGTDDIRVAVGADGTFLKADSAQASGVIWASATNNVAVSTKTANYTAVTTDEILNVDASGGSFTLSLYSAASNSGKFLRIKRIDSTIANSVTIDPNGTETIDGATTRRLWTKDETWVIYSDGSNWRVQDHKTTTAPTSFTMTIEGVTSNPTKASSPTRDSASWWRNGKTMFFRYDYDGGNASGAANGSGVYKFKLPNSSAWSIDTSTVPADTNGHQGYCGWASARNANSGSHFLGNTLVYDSTSIFLVLLSDAVGPTPVGSSFVEMAINGTKYSFQAQIPISEWDE